MPTYSATTKKEGLSKEDKGITVSTICVLSIYLSQGKETIYKNHSTQEANKGKDIWLR